MYPKLRSSRQHYNGSCWFNIKNVTYSFSTPLHLPISLSQMLSLTLQSCCSTCKYTNALILFIKVRKKWSFIFIGKRKVFYTLCTCTCAGFRFVSWLASYSNQWFSLLHYCPQNPQVELQWVKLLWET